MRAKRVFLIVLDSVGIGEMPDAARFGDAGSNTLLSCSKSPRFALAESRRAWAFQHRTA